MMVLGKALPQRRCVVQGERGFDTFPYGSSNSDTAHKFDDRASRSISGFRSGFLQLNFQSSWILV